MPLPIPNPNEDHEEFVGRCMADEEMIDEFEDADQRRAVCESQWEGGEASAKQSYPSVAQAVLGEPWAIRSETFHVICELVRDRVAGHKLSAQEIETRVGAARIRPGAARSGAIAVLPLFGVLSQRMNMMSAMSGGTSLEKFGEVFLQAMGDSTISAVVIDVDSPGGSVFGVEELANIIYGARGSKPIVAVVNSMAGSAAYWIIAAADEIVVTPSGEVGSIGILVAHEDLSGMAEKLGVKTTLLSAGRKKILGNPFEPLSEEARADIEDRIDGYYTAFVGAVARGRGVTPANVRAGFGEGGMVPAKEAVRLGMADTVGTLRETLDRLGGRESQASGTRAELVETPASAGSAVYHLTGTEVEVTERTETTGSDGTEVRTDLIDPTEPTEPTEPSDLKLRARQLRLARKS